MPWEWWHEVSVWAGAVAIQLIVVRWWCVWLRKDRWRAIYRIGYPLSLIVCGGFSIWLAMGQRNSDAYMNVAFYTAVIVWPVISLVVCAIIHDLLVLAERKKAKSV